GATLDDGRVGAARGQRRGGAGRHPGAGAGLVVAGVRPGGGGDEPVLRRGVRVRLHRQRAGTAGGRPRDPADTGDSSAFAHDAARGRLRDRHPGRRRAAAGVDSRRDAPGGGPILVRSPGRPRDGGRAVISVVVPVYNEQESLLALYAEISAVAQSNGLTLEVVFVDDGSKDGSWKVIRDIARQ